MATYRNIQISFWTDSKIADEFTPEDKYFYLYLLTNPHTNTCGCYELSIRQMTIDTGYSRETVEKLITRLQTTHDVIRYSHENKEVLIVNWRKYNWTTSPKLRASIHNSIKPIKTKSFKDFLLRCFENFDTEDYPDTLLDGEDTLLNEDGISIDEGFNLDSDDSVNPTKGEKQKEQKHEYGEYRHVRLTDSDYGRLLKDYGEEALAAGIKKVDEYCQETGKKYKDYNLTLRRWGIEGNKLPETNKISSGQVKRKLQ